MSYQDKSKSQELFFELLRISTGAETAISCVYSVEDWEGAYHLAEEQAVVGVLLDALEKIQENDAKSVPSKMLLLQWIGMAQMVEQTSQKMEEAGKTTVDYFHKNGFACQVLKGSAEVLNKLEGTKPTFHEKIRIASVREYDYDAVNKDIEELVDISKHYDNMTTVKKMKEIVPEYKSNNSVYEELDR